jgi:signal transduction histidine kinase
MARTDLKQVVASALEPRLTEPYHRWSFSLPKTPVEVMADPQRLGQAISNLLTNATKYTPAGKTIRVRLAKPNGAVVLKVEDEGVGIPPEDLERIFDGFYRTPDVTKWQPGSVGLGLYISRGLVRRMGGDLWAENRPGGGTVMCLKMPLIK